MPKKSTKKKLQRKKDTSFGSVYFDHTNLPAAATASTGFVLNLSLDEGLKLYLCLQQALGELNRLDRRLPASRQKGVALTMYPQQKRIAVNMGSLQETVLPNAQVQGNKAKKAKGVKKLNKPKPKERDTELD
jgi:hypothetical protein